jgi:hypothetical protein
MTDLITLPRTTLQQALWALEMSRRFVYADNRPQCDDAITALGAALEQPEQDTDCHAQGICQRSGYSIGRPVQEPVAVANRTPLEDSLRRAYYYDEHGKWRGPETDEWDRWHCVAKVASKQTALRREWRGFSEGALMGIYMDFDLWADKQWSNATFILRLMDTVQAKLKEKNHD